MADKQRIIKALMENGYKETSARTIAYGAKFMNNLKLAKKLEGAPWYISTNVWLDIYKKKEVEKKD